MEMYNIFRNIFLKKISKIGSPTKTKEIYELDFWINVINDYIEWYDGNKILYGTKPPEEVERIIVCNKKDSAILTWKKLHQEVKYLNDLKLDKNIFNGFNVLDVGSGPIPSALVFEGCIIYCLDPLWGKYIQSGFPAHYYDRIRIVNAYAEEMPFDDNFFDAIISVNAIDHVDDIYKTSKEIRRILKRKGFLRIHAHYHKATSCEPIEINDSIFMDAFSWCKGLRKISEGNMKTGYIAPEGESFVLWSNF